MPNARRVIFSSYVVPSQIDTMEEDSISKTTFVSTVGKTLGGKGSASIDATQWNDGWTSMLHSVINWEDLDDSDDTTGNRWEDTVDLWSGVLTLSTSGVQLTSDTTDCGFLYIKNTGSDKNALVSLNGDSNYHILLSENEAFTSEIDTSSVVKVKTASGTSTVEYFVSK